MARGYSDNGISVVQKMTTLTTWNTGHKALRQRLTNIKPNTPQAELDEAITLFLRQHTMLHAAAISPHSKWSYSDEILGDMAKAHMSVIPSGGEHSVIWLFWHMARIEDITMNVLIAGQSQLFYTDGWVEQIGAPVHNTGNGMTATAVADLSQAVNIAALLGYRTAVGKQTQTIVQSLTPEQIGQKVSPDRIQQLHDEGRSVIEGDGVLNYWSKRTIAGLLLMPATRHNFIHLNEAAKLKKKVMQSN